MSNLALRPPPKKIDSIFTYLNLNFNIIADAFARQNEIRQGRDSVTGMLEIDTGLVSVFAVVASLETALTSSGCFVQAHRISATPEIIRLRVYDNTFTQSTVAKVVNWIAIGE